MKAKSSLYTSIKKRLIICFILIAFVMGIICLVVFASNLLVSKRYNSIYENNSLIIEISNEVESLEAATERYLSTKTTDSLEEAHECMNSLGMLTYELKILAPYSEINMMMRDIGGMTDQLMSHVNAALLAKINRNAELYTDEFEKVSELSAYINSHCLSLNKLLTEENNRELTEHTRRQTGLNVVIILSFAVVSAACVAYIVYQSDAISKPIIQMAKSAHAISMGNFEMPDIECGTEDEISQMAEAFNNMKADIKDSLERLEMQRLLEVALKEEQMDNLRVHALLKDAEFVALQSQIQPHFLFNTINAGIQIAYREGADETVEFLENMSGLFRYNLKNMQEPVTLAAEAEQIERYLYLLEKRLAGSMLFEIHNDVPKEIQRRIKMPLMILQPLVENSYVHGIRGKTEGGRIDVTVCECRGRYAVKIEDNGAGMSARDVERLIKGERINENAERAKSLGIGVHNVKNRLELFYERKDVMEIQSIEGEGTEVIVFLEEVQH